ncbi:transposase [Longibaculum muris]
MFAEQPEVKKALWWSSEFFVSSCEKDTSEKTIKEYIKNQSK